MKSQWVIRVSALAALIAAGVVFARWAPSDAGRAGLREDLIAGGELRDIDLARASFRRGRYDEAIAHARSVLEREPNRSRALRILGEAYWSRDERGDRETAIEVFRKLDEVETAASARYESGTEFYRLGLIRLRVGDSDSARAAFARAAEIQRAILTEAAEGRPARSTWYYDLARFEARAGNRDAALEAFERAVDLGFDNPRHALSAADLSSIHDDPRFLAAAERIVGRSEQPELRTD